MHILGNFQAFQAWVSDEPKREADTVLYRTGPQGRVVEVVFPRERVEWEFPANEVITFQMLAATVRKAILVTSWSLT